MQIHEKLMQFHNQKALLLVTGAHHCVVYQASNGSIEKIYESRIDEPTYSDNEGLFKSSAGEGAFGSVLESKKRTAIRDLSKSLAQEIFALVHKGDIDSVYLFVSPQIKSELNNDLHEEVKAKIVAAYSGNYTKEEPFTLLEMIQKDQEEDPHKDATGEAKKLLEKGQEQ